MKGSLRLLTLLAAALLAPAVLVPPEAWAQDEKKEEKTGETGKAARPAPPAAPPVTGTAMAVPPRIGLRYYLAVSAVVFGLGITIIVVRRNAIAVLMGIELLLNAAGLNFVAFSRFVARDVIDGQVVTIFVIVIAAAEAAVALAITLNIFNNLNTVTVDEADALKG